MLFTLQDDQLLYLVKHMPNSDIAHKKQYEDANIIMFSYTIKNSDRHNIVGYRVDFKNMNFNYYRHNNKMLALQFKNIDEKKETGQVLKYDDNQFRILIMNEHKYFILAKIINRTKKGK